MASVNKTIPTKGMQPLKMVTNCRLLGATPFR